MRALCVLGLMLVVIPAGANAQSLGSSVSIQAALGPTMVDPGHNVSAAVGFSPVPRVTLLVDVQRTQLSSRFTRHERGGSAFRGGTLTAVSGEARVNLWPAGRVTPYALAGLGAGLSRPNANATFGDSGTNSARF